jgi:predicted dehydrogenase
MATIRIGVIGCGGISGHHLKVLASKELAKADHKVTAFCDVDRERAAARQKEFGTGGELVTADYREVLDSGKVDVVLVCTPHPFHPEAAVAAFERGIHVLLEKPVAITVREARAINAAHRKSKTVFTVHFQNRHEARFRWVKEQIAGGLLGRLQKANITWSPYRTQAYYNSGTWRGKWSSEGGGVMMNQCPHDLDLLVWWLGLPKRVDARIWLGHCHDVEIEDEVMALVEFAGGGTGIINAGTCDYPGPNRWDLIGENGAIQIDGETVKAVRLDEGLSHFTRNTKETWAVPPSHPVEVKLEGTDRPAGSHGCWLNFLAAIRGEEKIWMEGEEGALSLELANAIIASGYLGRPVDLPLDEALYDGVLAGLRAGKSGEALSPQKRR